MTTRSRYIPRVACPDCYGSGAYCPDCWLCKGARFVKVRKALANGYSREDLENVENGECLCPTWDCRGDHCTFCEGTGEREPADIEREVTRVLICALTGRIPGSPYRTHYGRVLWNDGDLLSLAAGRFCEERRWVRIWRELVFGDDLILTGAGRVEAERRLPGWLAQYDVSLCHVDDDGRWGSDGGREIEP